MDVQDAHVQLFFTDQSIYFGEIGKRDTEFASVVTGRDLQVAAGQDIGTNANANGVTAMICFGKLDQVRQAIDVDVHAQGTSLGDLLKRNTVGRIEDLLRLETRGNRELHFIDRTAIHIGSNAMYVLQDM